MTDIQKGIPITEAGSRLSDYANGFVKLSKPDTQEKAIKIIREEVLRIEREAYKLGEDNFKEKLQAVIDQHGEVSTTGLGFAVHFRWLYRLMRG